jgi:hypothetical protein
MGGSTSVNAGNERVSNGAIRPNENSNIKCLDVGLPHFLTLRVFLAIRSMSAIGIICHWNLAPPAATRFPSSIIIAVIVLPHRGQFRRGPLMRNTCSE